MRVVIFLYLMFASLPGKSQATWTWVHGDNTPYNLGTYGMQGFPLPSNKPGSRQRATSWTDKDGNFWLFGGLGYSSNASSQYLNDLWKYDPLTNMWTWVSGSNTGNSNGSYGTKGQASITNMPGARYEGGSWVDNNGNLWLFGGYGYATGPTPQFMNDLWKFDINTNLWTWISGDNVINSPSVPGTKGVPSTNNKPGARYGGGVWKDLSGNLWLLGGKGYSSLLAGDLNDLWKYNIITNEWTWIGGDDGINITGAYGIKHLSSPVNAPGSRMKASCWE
ncbi:MAG: galactose oxidase, partial [Pedobacter sp.]